MFADVIAPLIDDFISFKLDRSETSEAKAFKIQLNRFANYIVKHKPWVRYISDLERRDIEDYIGHLRTVEYSSYGNEYRNSFVYRHLRALDKFFQQLITVSVDNDHIPNAGIIQKADFPSPNRSGVKHFPAWLDKLILKEIRDLPENKYREIKFKTMMIFIYYTGARIKDLCTLEFDCIIQKLGYKWVRVFSNKTRRYYEIPITNEVSRYLLLYKNAVEEREEVCHPTTRQSVKFMFVDRGTADGLKHTTSLKIKNFGLKVRQKACDLGYPVEDIEELQLTSHKYRHNVGIKLIRMGADPLLVAEFLGHTDLSMASAYLHEDEKEIEEIMNDLLSDDSLQINIDGELLDSVLLSKGEVLNNCGAVSKVDGGWCTHFGELPPCGEAAYECWKCDSLRPDFDNENYVDNLMRKLEDHKMLRERNIQKGLLGAAKAEEFVIKRIESFIEEVKDYAQKRKI